MGNDKSNYSEIANQSRLKVLDMIYAAQTSHIGSNFSVADIMAVLFEHVNLDKDKVVLSAGWKAAMLYYHLWRKDRITKKELNSYCQPGSDFIGLAEPIHEDIPFAGGSMGMGLAAGVGIAYAKKLKNEEGTVYVIESDGGMQCGITWEALWFAAQHNLDNLILIIDNNGFQAMGKTSSILDTKNLAFKLISFDWDGTIINGHDYNQIQESIALSKITPNKPNFVVAETIKGSGVSFMENNNLYHYKQLSKEEYEKAKKELL